MNTQQTTQHTNHLITLISGLFLVAALVLAASLLGFSFNIGDATSPHQTVAQTTVQQNGSASFTINTQAGSTATGPYAVQVKSSYVDSSRGISVNIPNDYNSQQATDYEFAMPEDTTINMTAPNSSPAGTAFFGWHGCDGTGGAGGRTCTIDT